MGHSEFEHILCENCAPVLLGCKIANLVAIEHEPDEPIEPFLDRYRCLLAGKQIRIRILCQGRHRCQLLFYRPEQLWKVLNTEPVQGILTKAGYPTGAPIDHYMDILSERMRMPGQFPHEIGLFLGYPPADVTAFQENAGKNYILCRYWKVYSHPEEAARTFDLFDRCKSYMCFCLKNGMTLSQILGTVYCA